MDGSRKRRRSVLDMGKSQVGEVKTGGIAGNDYIANNLADLPEGLQRVLADSHEYSQLMVKGLESMQTRLQRSIDRVRDDLDLYRITDASDRAARRREGDARLHEIAERADAAAFAAQQAASRIEILAGRLFVALAVLAVVVFVVMLVVTALAVDRLTTAAGTAVAVALASWLARGR
jgi:hypothetical protein